MINRRKGCSISRKKTGIRRTGGTLLKIWWIRICSSWAWLRGMGCCGTITAHIKTKNWKKYQYRVRSRPQGLRKLIMMTRVLWDASRLSRKWSKKMDPIPQASRDEIHLSRWEKLLLEEVKWNHPLSEKRAKKPTMHQFSSPLITNPNEAVRNSQGKSWKKKWKHPKRKQSKI